MKNLKISEPVHDELRIFAATTKDKMSDIGGYAIMQYLSAMGHRFSKPKANRVVYSRPIRKTKITKPTK